MCAANLRLALPLILATLLDELDALFIDNHSLIDPLEANDS
ncbi:hypothetical protein VTL71DRAFT_4416 [Oculimacula yallundae]|uniref:Uncharacterized protein n=1 Tax=Oculimacula yallundae TaxID=86028 RepID=A0ABR4C1Z4_9HELO